MHCPPAPMTPTLTTAGLQYNPVLPRPLFEGESSYVTPQTFSNSILAPCFPGAMPALSTPVDPEIQATQWKSLTAKFDETRLRRHN